MKEIHNQVQNLLKEVSRVIVGQEEMLEGIVIGLLTGGHVLLEGVPGLAKTLALSSVARALSVDFQRIQFTPDLLPTDLIGTMVFNPKSGEFYPKKGPLFTNVVLADEINRAPAKVQSALLEAMAEKQVTIGETSYTLEQPFLVLATQNPIEQEGTYPLPEAQMDRFMFKLVVSQPNREDEMRILERMGQKSTSPSVKSVLSEKELLQAMQQTEQVHMDQRLKEYMVELVMASRRPQEYGLPQLQNWLRLGVSPRATLSLLQASKAKAFLQGRDYVNVEDIKALAHPVFRHRLLLSYEAEAESVSPDEIVNEILRQVELS